MKLDLRGPQSWVHRVLVRKDLNAEKAWEVRKESPLNLQMSANHYMKVSNLSKAKEEASRKAKEQSQEFIHGWEQLLFPLPGVKNFLINKLDRVHRKILSRY